MYRNPEAIPPVLTRGGLFVAVMVFLGGCGYHVRSSVQAAPKGIESLGIPPFKNLSSQFKIEQRVSAAVLREFSVRTHIPVSPASSGVDTILLGEIRNVSSSPVTFGSDTFGSAFLITVQMSVKLVKSKDSSVIWQNPNFLYRERYVLNSKLPDFFSEENPALDRMAHDFAASLVSAIINR